MVEDLWIFGLERRRVLCFFEVRGWFGMGLGGGGGGGGVMGLGEGGFWVDLGGLF